MNCLHCGRPTRVIATEPFGKVGRRVTRLCTVPTSVAHEGAEFVTYEVPETVARGVGLPRLLSALAAVTRGSAQRQAAADRRAQALALLRRGQRVSTVAREIGVTEARVRQYRAESWSRRP